MITQYAALKALLQAAEEHNRAEATSKTLQDWRVVEPVLRAKVIAAAMLVAATFKPDEN